MLIIDIKLILDDETIVGDKAVVKYFKNGEPQETLHKHFPGVLYVEETADYNITTRNIDMMKKLYLHHDIEGKNEIKTALSKTFSYQKGFYHEINYFAFAVLLVIDKNTALDKLEAEFVLDSAYADTLHVLGLILIFKHDHFEAKDISRLKAFLTRIQKQIEPHGDPTLPIPHGRRLEGEDRSRIFVTGSNIHIRSFKYSIIPNIIRTIHEIEYGQLGKFLEGINYEINSDRIALISRMDELEFPEDAKKSLDEIDKIYFGSPDKFECKSCMGLIRTFFEEIFRELVQGLSKITGKPYESESDRFSNRRKYLLGIDFINNDEAEFYQRYYNLVSNEGIHSLTSKREYVRISRNMAIELGLLLLNRYNEYKKNG